ncbi:nuclear pore glycoprotein p62-like [Toxorhynchites rutilus septentrionalis]|uniref:nuclear pore glycoprotein p62-like n=1 Tax=Toxorhynchites rutilus septentrionalis TaxID=329112 RepID=UPI00247A20F1|nr:nuclear pore glycoprotein p62-like [Toxorhynchites rutilus septentrionalis]
MFTFASIVFRVSSCSVFARKIVVSSKMSFTFGNPVASVAPTMGTTNPVTTASTGFGFGASTFGVPAATTSAAAATSSSVPTLSFGAGLTATTSATAASTAAGQLTLGSFTAPKPAAQPAANLTTTTQTTQSSSVSGTQLNFCQLEEFINKWTLELEEQEKLFTNQATQVNAWDKLLLGNGEKIVALNEAVEKVKAEQDAMEQELEFVTAQHTELEECIIPLEEELSKIVQVDIERGQTYSMAETLDSQLKQMSEDLKEVIEHLNESNKYSDPSDPLVQIGKILNAHMNSLQWIESSTSSITTRLEEIGKMHDTLRKDNERSFRLTYYDN